MRDYFMLIYWAFLFIFIDIEVNGFDLIHDFIGYLMIAYAVNKIGETYFSFREVSNFALAAIFISVISFLFFRGGLSFTGEDSPVLTIVSIFSIFNLTEIVELIMVWKLCDSIVKMAELKKDEDLVKVAKQRRLLYFLYLPISWIAEAIIILNQDLFWFIIIPLTVLALILMFMMMKLMEWSGDTSEKNSEVFE